jgi:carbohydrate kinase (thermoresistant glucokinase family)
MPIELTEPRFIIVMGVSGSGKSTIGAKLAIALGWSYEDADSFHPPANVEKMHAGHALTDEDRWPWLKAIAAWTENARRDHHRAVIGCSALKRAYRQILAGNHSDVRLVYLKGEPRLIAGRMALRHGHFMPPSLLESQFAALEEPGKEERPVVVSIGGTPQEIVGRILAQLGMQAQRTAS